MPIYDFGLIGSTFGLIFLTPEPGDMPDRPRAHVYMTDSTPGEEYDGVSKDLALITADCVSFQEFEAEIERLKRELDEIKKKAKKKYAASK